MKYFILVASVLCIAIVLYNMVGWIIVSSGMSSFEEAKSLYIDRYPQLIGSATKITILNIFLSILAGLGFLKLQHINSKAGPGTFRGLSGFAFFLAAWQIFSLL